MSASDPPERPTPLTYADAGVDVDAGQRFVARIAPACARTHRPELLAGAGGFAALATLPTRYREPVLVTGTDGVGTKLLLALERGFCHTIGQDLVAMCVNDVLTSGAEPFLFLDYYATAHLDVDRAAEVVEGIARACELAGCALAGGETAEMPDLYAPGHFDLAGFCIGVAERAAVVDGRALAPGDVLVGLASDGPHSNGYSLVRRLLTRDEPPEPVLAALFAPTRIYARAVAAALAAGPVHGMAHVTGGGLIENLPRMLRKDSGLALRVDLRALPPRPEFAWLRATAGIDATEMLGTFNLGLGYAIAVPPDAVDALLNAMADAGETAWCCGRVERGTADQLAAAPAAAEPGEPSELLLDATGGVRLA
jgi:phosphoribosylformylglycinamidine cyclo-ligase